MDRNFKSTVDINGIIGDIVVINTLVDITKTDTISQFTHQLLPYTDAAGVLITTEARWNISRQQQSNYETLVQILSLRGTPVHIDSPIRTLNTSQSQQMFDPQYKYHTYYWSLIFIVEYTGLYFNHATNEEFGELKKDFNNVPINHNLTETVEFKTPVWSIDTPNIEIIKYE
jgi:hypothetical protein